MSVFMNIVRVNLINWFKVDLRVGRDGLVSNMTISNSRVCGYVVKRRGGQISHVE